MGDGIDPMIGGLLEGSAFLAARVQLKIKHEFAEFTTNLLDQLAPHYLAPSPSLCSRRRRPKFGDPALRDGRTIARGAYLDAAYRELERNIACRFALAAPISSVAVRNRQCGIFRRARSAAGVGIAWSAHECSAGLRLQLTVRAAERSEDEPPDSAAHTRPELDFSAAASKT